MARMVNGMQTIAVAGAYGKTTTTSMVYQALCGAGLDPTFILGGELQGSELGARLGQSPYCVVEADESDASFLELTPYIAVITNIEDDHLITGSPKTYAKPSGSILIGSKRVAWLWPAVIILRCRYCWRRGYQRSGNLW